MHYLVTGGSGLIGRQLCRQLAINQHSVSVLTRNVRQAGRKLHPSVMVVEKIEAVKRPVDVVINLAGANLAEQRWTPTRKAVLVDSRVHNTRTLVDWVSTQQWRPSVLVSGSAIGWYGSDRADQVLTEDATPGDDFPSQICQRWEQEAMRAQNYGIRVCCVRTGVVLDKEGGALLKMLLPFKLGIGGPIGTGKQWISWIAMKDMIRVLCWLAENESAQGPYNATAPNPQRNEDFAKTLGDALHRPTFLRAPEAAIRVMLGEMAELVIKGQRVVPARLTSGGFSFTYPELGAALAQTLSRN